MLDDGLGPAVYDELQCYDMGDQVDLFDVGCMSLDLVESVARYDLIITVDALDETGYQPGTLFRFKPEDMATRPFGSQSLHDLRLSDLFESASLLGYSAEGVCLGMQIANANPAELMMGLTEEVSAKLADLVDMVLAELVYAGVEIRLCATQEKVSKGYHHQISQKEESF